MVDWPDATGLVLDSDAIADTANCVTSLLDRCTACCLTNSEAVAFGEVWLSGTDPGATDICPVHINFAPSEGTVEATPRGTFLSLNEDCELSDLVTEERKA